MRNRLTNCLLAMIAVLLAAGLFAPAPVERVASAQLPTREADRIRTGAALPYSSGVATGELFQLSVSPFTPFIGANGSFVELLTAAAPTETGLSYVNNFSNLGGGTFDDGAYAKHGGLVYLRGSIKSTSVAALPLQITTLPAGHRPYAVRRFAVWTSNGSASAMGAVDVYPSGAVILAEGHREHVALDGIQFVANQ